MLWGGTMMSDVPALALVLLLLTLAVADKPAWAGLAAGLAFSMRFACATFVPVGAIYVLFHSSKRWRAMTIYSLVAAVPIGLVLARNFVLIGRLTPPQLASGASVSADLVEAAQTLLGGRLRGVLIILIFLGAVGLWRWSPVQACGRWLLPVSGAAYLALIF